VTETTVVLRLRGDFDLSQSRLRRDAFDSTADDALVVLDLEHAGFIDSTVLGAIVLLHKNTSARGGRLVVAGANAMARRLFTITSLAKLLDVRETVAGALEGRDARSVEVVAE
jgi:anti-sigma B factor antagonist